MESFTLGAYLRRIAAAALGGAVGSPAALLISADRLSWVLGDVGGIIFLYLVAPACGAVAGTAAVLLLWGARARVVGPVALLTVFTAGLVLYPALIRHREAAGYYRLPPGFDASTRSVAELVSLAFDDNYELAGASLEQLGARGSDGADGLVLVVERARSRWGRDTSNAS